MKTFALLVFASLWIIHIRVSSADYRYRRMPPQPPRAPPVPPYLKKWHNAHLRQSLNRPRPIPVHLPPQQQQQFKKPIGPPISLPLPAPKRSPPPPPPPPPSVRPKIATPAPQVQIQNWNNNQVYMNRQQEKPFLSSPKVQVSEYDYHVQTNQIPNHSNLIKQVDEKGPIHTIPAPNLSPADKPKHVEIQAPKQKTVVEVQKAHQYQVTEAPDFIKGFNQEINFGGFQQETKDFVSHYKSPDFVKNFQVEYAKNYQQEKSPEYVKTYHQEKPSEYVKNFQQEKPADFLKNTYHQQQESVVQTPHLLQTEAVLTPNDQLGQVSQQDLFKFFQSYQQPLIETYNIPAMQQPQLQEHLMQQQAYQTLIAQQPIFQNDPNAYLTQIKPEFHSFNYEEPTQKSSSSHVSAEYTVQSEPNNVDTEVNYFQNNFNYPGITEDVDPVSFFSSLPNKEAADTLSSLQEAGKRKVNSQEDAESRENNSGGMAIYVPDDSEENSEKNEREESNGKEAENYEDDYGYAQEEESEGDVSEKQAGGGGGDSFGSRIKPKKY